MSKAGIEKIQVRQDYFTERHPGVYLEDRFGLPHRVEFATGVPAFLGLLSANPGLKLKPNTPVMLSLWSQFQHQIGTPVGGSYLAYAVRGFFENGGQRCYVVYLEDDAFKSIDRCMDAISSLNTIDLVCAPDLVRNRARAFDNQQELVDCCQKAGDRFAILDSLQGDNGNQVWDQWSAIDGRDGAIYYPWIKVKGFSSAFEVVPPSGHVAGVYARTDRLRGVHKAPANEVLEGVVDLERHLTNADQDDLNPKRINCLRSFPGRGIRVWGARTLSGQTAWTYVNVRRIFLTAVRWIDWNMSDIVFEPNTPKLWARIERELTTYFNDQFRAGALKGRTPQEAFYIKCNAETNPPELRELSQVVTEIGLAPTVPYEFVVVRLIHGAKGVTLSGPTRPRQIL
jgi:uncharacterized protein